MDPTIPCGIFSYRDSSGGCTIFGRQQYTQFAELGGLAIAAVLLPGWYKALPLGILLYAMAKPGNGPVVPIPQ